MAEFVPFNQFLAETEKAEPASAANAPGAGVRAAAPWQPRSWTLPSTRR